MQKVFYHQNLTAMFVESAGYYDVIMEGKGVSVATLYPARGGVEVDMPGYLSWFSASVTLAMAGVIVRRRQADIDQAHAEALELTMQNLKAASSDAIHVPVNGSRVLALCGRVALGGATKDAATCGACAGQMERDHDEAREVNRASGQDDRPRGPQAATNLVRRVLRGIDGVYAVRSRFCPDRGESAVQTIVFLASDADSEAVFSFLRGAFGGMKVRASLAARFVSITFRPWSLVDDEAEAHEMNAS